MKTPMLTFTEDELLALLHTTHRTAMIGADGSLIRADGIDMDEMFRVQLRNNYASLLASGNIDLLPVTDETDTLAPLLQIDSGTCIATLTLPASVISPVEILLSGWDIPLSKFVVPESPEAMLQKSVYTRAGSVNPVGVLYPDRLLLYTAPQADSKLLLARMVARQPVGTYVFPEAALPFMLRDVKF